jgi:hypothetical protein
MKHPSLHRDVQQLSIEFKPSPRLAHPRRTAAIDAAIAKLVRVLRQRQVRRMQAIELPIPAGTVSGWYLMSHGWMFRVLVQWQQSPDAALHGRVDIAWEPD